MGQTGTCSGLWTQTRILISSKFRNSMFETRGSKFSSGKDSIHVFGPSDEHSCLEKTFPNLVQSLVIFGRFGRIKIWEVQKFNFFQRLNFGHFGFDPTLIREVVIVNVLPIYLIIQDGPPHSSSFSRNKGLVRNGVLLVVPIKNITIIILDLK